MKRVILVLSCSLLLMPSISLAQAGQPTAAQVKADVEKTQAIKAKIDEAQSNPRFVRTLTNVQIELTLSDQMGSAAPEKKVVSMIVSSGSWGKIRSSGSVRAPGDGPVGVDLNVDARPFVSVEGPIQLELTVNYSPGVAASEKDTVRRQTGINQSQTLVLQNGKAMVISQAADPVSDRKVTVEAKATVLK